MIFSNKLKYTLFLLFTLSLEPILAQSILPPVMEWQGKSEILIVKPGHPWITPTETADFITTPNYNETMQWLKKLADASPLMHLISIGKSVEGREIMMVIASAEKTVTAGDLKKSEKPLLFVHAGIHAGEIDGKDAGMMLLRDIAFGNKKHLLDGVNFLFIPILNVDGHERISSFNRPNQRGPQNMGWRTNAQNLNLNRDFAKLDTKEIRSVVQVMHDFDPLLYLDLHVTDGADYQYDITFGGLGEQGYSKSINHWLEKIYKPLADKDLSANGHIPGQLLFAVNDRDFSMGNALMQGGPRFSDSYGDLRHMAAVLVENHSLKPYRQRVLGTYILLESTLKILAKEGASLKESTIADRAERAEKIPLQWKIPQMEKTTNFETLSALHASDKPAAKPDSLNLLGIDSRIVQSNITNADYVEWLGTPVKMKIANYKATEPIAFIDRPKSYWVPAAYPEIIERLQRHGIQMEIIKEPREILVEMYRMEHAKFQNDQGKALPYEGHMQVTATTQAEMRRQLFAAGSASVSTDQPLGDLAILLLEPTSPDSFFSWGFFPEIFQRTEYIEAYVMEPTMKKMLEDDAQLKKEFEQKKTADAIFADNPDAIFSWFYSKTKYYDERYLLYPVGREKI